MKTYILTQLLLVVAVMMQLVSGAMNASHHYQRRLVEKQAVNTPTNNNLCDCSCNGCSSCVPVKYVNGRQTSRCFPQRLAKRGLDIGTYQCYCEYDAEMAAKVEQEEETLSTSDQDAKQPFTPALLETSWMQMG